MRMRSNSCRFIDSCLFESDFCIQSIGPCRVCDCKGYKDQILKNNDKKC